MTEDTPDFLLREYFNTLAATGDLSRMIARVTDPARQERLFKTTGSDALALAQLTTP